jgi:putative inorganic carbon (hco3(-)) transporter
MRDIVVMSIVLMLAVVALRRPWIGVLLWVWVSLMNPHRFTYGFAYDAPVAMIAALATLIGFLATRERESPMKGPGVTLFVLFTVWVTITWALGKNPSEQFAQWDKIMKVNFMVIVCLMLFRTKEQIFLLAWVLTMSIAILSTKGGVFTILNGGSYRVWGPSGSWVEGNNEFAVATIMVIPLLRFIQLQVTHKWLGRLMIVGMFLCAASALGSHSRGALVAILMMSVVLWWRGSNRIRNGVLFVVIGLLALQFMPEHWTERMDTIENFEEDKSALGRFSAWWVSWNLALSHPLGVGLSITYPEFFIQHSPYGLSIGTPVAHSIWFQVMGHHGFIGFGLFAGIWIATWLGGQGLQVGG